MGDPAAGGYTVSSSTNTFNGVVPGVTFTVGAVASDVTVSVGSDAGAISDKVKALIGRGQRGARRAVQRHRQRRGAGG